MDNAFINGLKNETNLTHTENGALTYRSSMSGILDLFGLGGAYRNRDEYDCIRLFTKAWDEDPELALKCLFYLRDITEGQGERRFFRTVFRELAITRPDVAAFNIGNVPFYGRWDDLYCLVGTPVEDKMFAFMREQLELDLHSYTPSLLAKWLKSENASSKETKKLAAKTRYAFGMSAREYRKTLSYLRNKINIVETLMSQNRWDEIKFDKIPSRAGFVYRNAFARHDITKERYKAFMEDVNTKVNAKALYPYEVIHQVLGFMYGCIDEPSISSLTRQTYQKYWDGLASYIKSAPFNGLAVVDTSGSMWGRPIEVAVSLGLICAEKSLGPYHNHFITFSATPELQEIHGTDITEKVISLYNTDWGWNTNIEAVFDLILKTAKNNHLTSDQIPQNIIIISDMEFDVCSGMGYGNEETLFSSLAKRYAAAGYALPNLVFWNVDARQNNVPMQVRNGVTLVSGFSPILFEQIMQGKTAWDLVLDKLLSDRYKQVWALTF